MNIFHEFIIWANNILWGQLLIYLLLGTGFFFTLFTGAVQLRLFLQSWREILGGRSGCDHNAISPFQAFATGLASRVGTGNIAGVAIAITMGGPGAVFWMWMTALLGMSSAFAESTLGQLFKVSHHDGTFRGGPAYYIQQGLGFRFLGIIFAGCMVLAFGLVFNAAQANSIVAATESAWGWNKLNVGIALVLMTTPIIFGGVRMVARVAEWLVPVMALGYFLLATYIMAIHLPELPALFLLIIKNAFGIQQISGGMAAYAIGQAMMQGIKRGLFSNEAGMGSAPNMAATATTTHPVNQGLLQMCGVFIDTIVVCSATAAIILLSGVHEQSLGLNGVQLTQKALESQVGSWGGHFLAVAIFLFAYSSIIGNYAYAEGNIEFIKNRPSVLFLFRLAVLGMILFGSLGSLPLVWDMADLSMGIMALINLVAIILLSPNVLTVLKDYDRQRKQGVKQPKFNISLYPKLSQKLNETEKKVWQE